MAGAVLADMTLVAIVASGLGVLLAASEAAFQLLKWAGAGYLAYLGWRLLRTDAAAALPGPAGARPPEARALFLRSFLVAATNPKALLFMSAFLPQFIRPAAPLLPQYLALAAILAILNLAAMLAYATLGARMMPAHENLNKKQVPRRTPSLSDSTCRRQPCMSHTRLAIASPSPRGKPPSSSGVVAGASFSRPL